MLFNSSVFLFVFLPVVALVTFLLARLTRSNAPAQAFLSAASLFFYGWWKPPFALLLVGSILINYTLGSLLRAASGPMRVTYLVLGMLANLGVLAYFKYWAFLCTTLGLPVPESSIFLPLAISFFTFTQITYLCDMYSGKIESNGFLDYVLFVAFFPHLIAGPIVHHRQLIPQFRGEGVFRARWENIVPGLALFILGLSKKMLIADLFAPFATDLFHQAAGNDALPLAHAWYGMIAYAFQIYFDFSGYSDMALGLALVFNLRFPMNFNSPYQAASVIDFWRRWHITLSQFLRDYLYIPLGGSRCGMPRMLTNLMITMLIGGLWHGANWTFVFWGGLHGSFLIVNHLWAHHRKRTGREPLPRAAGVALTFVCVLIAWVFFRAETFSSGWKVLTAMFGGTLMSDTVKPFILKVPEVLMLLAGLYIVFKRPNTLQLMRDQRPCIEPIEGETPAQGWKLTPRWAVACGVLFAVCLIRLNQPSPFIYFQF